MMDTILQSLVVYAVVACCTVYAAWALAPSSLKRRFATTLMARSPSLRTSRRWQGWAQQKGGCGSGCSGCSSGAAPTAAKIKPVRIRLVKRL